MGPLTSVELTESVILSFSLSDFKSSDRPADIPFAHPFLPLSLSAPAENLFTRFTHNSSSCVMIHQYVLVPLFSFFRIIHLLTLRLLLFYSSMSLDTCFSVEQGGSWKEQEYFKVLCWPLQPPSSNPQPHYQ